MYGEGVNKAGEVLDLAVSMGLVDKSGAWYSYQGDRMGQGRENAKTYLLEHEEIFLILEQAILEANGINRTLASEVEA
jgi:recombination protein RecA